MIAYLRPHFQIIKEGGEEYIICFQIFDIKGIVV